MSDGKTLAVVIHQPSATIFSQFDDILLLGETGEVSDTPKKCCLSVCVFQTSHFPRPWWLRCAILVPQRAWASILQDVASLLPEASAHTSGRSRQFP